ncbi:hypothetical protein [Nocardiopsis sp. LOL_012]|uniref:hypothetical protein n=1 Tax=Nocardiopsis sp. LOL_012 TaxID=3345409 RepID=UPI003A87DEC3
MRALNAALARAFYVFAQQTNSRHQMNTAPNEPPPLEGPLMAENDVLDPDAGKPRLLAEKCSTCVFRPGNPMRLVEGRLAELVRHNREVGAGLTCHQTLSASGADAPNAWCKGFHDAYPDTTAIRFAHTVLGGVVEVEPPK